MKVYLILALFIVCKITSGQPNPVYNKALADSLGADERGMKFYVLCLLKTGPNTTTDKTIKDSLFAGHMANIRRLAEEGKLVVAGPLEKNEKQYRGIFIFNVPTLEEAQQLLITDPAVKAKIFEADLFQWYGSAALPKYMDFDKMIHPGKM